MDIDKILEEAENKMKHSIEAMEKKFTNVRAGRANPAILNKVEVLYYGVPTPLNQLAQISIPEARQLSIKPFDKSCLGAIEKGIFEANIGLTPNNNGETIILNIPPLTFNVFVVISKSLLNIPLFMTTELPLEVDIFPFKVPPFIVIFPFSSE